MTYDLEIVVEHRYKMSITGENKVDAVNKALEFAMSNESQLTLVDSDYGVESIKESK